METVSTDLTGGCVESHSNGSTDSIHDGLRGHEHQADGQNGHEVEVPLNSANSGSTDETADLKNYCKASKCDFTSRPTEADDMINIRPINEYNISLAEKQIDLPVTDLSLTASSLPPLADNFPPDQSCSSFGSSNEYENFTTNESIHRNDVSLDAPIIESDWMNQSEVEKAHDCSTAFRNTDDVDNTEKCLPENNDEMMDQSGQHLENCSEENENATILVGMNSAVDCGQSMDGKSVLVNEDGSCFAENSSSTTEIVVVAKQDDVDACSETTDVEATNKESVTEFTPHEPKVADGVYVRELNDSHEKISDRFFSVKKDERLEGILRVELGTASINLEGDINDSTSKDIPLSFQLSETDSDVIPSDDKVLTEVIHSTEIENVCSTDGGISDYLSDHKVEVALYESPSADAEQRNIETRDDVGDQCDSNESQNDLDTNEIETNNDVSSENDWNAQSGVIRISKQDSNEMYDVDARIVDNLNASVDQDSVHDTNDNAVDHYEATESDQTNNTYHNKEICNVEENDKEQLMVNSSLMSTTFGDKNCKNGTPKNVSNEGSIQILETISNKEDSEICTSSGGEPIAEILSVESVTNTVIQEISNLNVKEEYIHSEVDLENSTISFATHETQQNISDHNTEENVSHFEKESYSGNIPLESGTLEVSDRNMSNDATPGMGTNTDISVDSETQAVYGSDGYTKESDTYPEKEINAETVISDSERNEVHQEISEQKIKGISEHFEMESVGIMHADPVTDEEHQVESDMIKNGSFSEGDTNDEILRVDSETRERKQETKLNGKGNDTSSEDETNTEHCSVTNDTVHSGKSFINDASTIHVPTLDECILSGGREENDTCNKFSNKDSDVPHEHQEEETKGYDMISGGDIQIELSPFDSVIQKSQDILDQNIEINYINPECETEAVPNGTTDRPSGSVDCLITDASPTDAVTAVNVDGIAKVDEECGTLVERSVNENVISVERGTEAGKDCVLLETRQMSSDELDQLQDADSHTSHEMYHDDTSVELSNVLGNGDHGNEMELKDCSSQSQDVKSHHANARDTIHGMDDSPENTRLHRDELNMEDNLPLNIDCTQSGETTATTIMEENPVEYDSNEHFIPCDETEVPVEVSALEVQTSGEILTIVDPNFVDEHIPSTSQLEIENSRTNYCISDETQYINKSNTNMGVLERGTYGSNEFIDSEEANSPGVELCATNSGISTDLLTESITNVIPDPIHTHVVSDDTFSNNCLLQASFHEDMQGMTFNKDDIIGTSDNVTVPITGEQNSDYIADSSSNDKHSLINKSLTQNIGYSEFIHNAYNEDSEEIKYNNGINHVRNERSAKSAEAELVLSEMTQDEGTFKDSTTGGSWKNRPNTQCVNENEVSAKSKNDTESVDDIESNTGLVHQAQYSGAWGKISPVDVNSNADAESSETPHSFAKALPSMETKSDPLDDLSAAVDADKIEKILKSDKISDEHSGTNQAENANVSQNLVETTLETKVLKNKDGKNDKPPSKITTRPTDRRSSSSKRPPHKPLSIAASKTTFESKTTGKGATTKAALPGPTAKSSDTNLRQSVNRTTKSKLTNSFSASVSNTSKVTPNYSSRPMTKPLGNTATVTAKRVLANGRPSKDLKNDGDLHSNGVSTTNEKLTKLHSTSRISSPRKNPSDRISTSTPTKTCPKKLTNSPTLIRKSEPLESASRRKGISRSSASAPSASSNSRNSKLHGNDTSNGSTGGFQAKTTSLRPSQPTADKQQRASSVALARAAYKRPVFKSAASKSSTTKTTAVSSAAGTTAVRSVRKPPSETRKACDEQQ